MAENDGENTGYRGECEDTEEPAGNPKPEHFISEKLLRLLGKAMSEHRPSSAGDTKPAPEAGSESRSNT